MSRSKRDYIHILLFFEIHSSLFIREDSCAITRSCALFFSFLSHGRTRKFTPVDRARLLFPFGDHFSICQCLPPQKRYFYENVSTTCPHSCGHYINTCPTMNLRVVQDLISDIIHRLIIDQHGVLLLTPNTFSGNKCNREILEIYIPDRR